ncbi:MAG TPA: D-alanyl-D-alanine carboxypeptidase/D-alanyl-D-alanine-endopeptidase, partial [Gemmatimonadaceae bacterium]|nr:D-alanyl-D-alanine carboxypeptidase/D-alanyl-D-alanine-endopeptidase [Gemmatimonadaceae bacterium]
GVTARIGARALRRAIDSVANAPEFNTGYFGILAVTTTGDTLYSRNAGKLFMPASNQKLLTSSVALTQLGPAYRFRTLFVAHGPVADGVLEGDLGIVGRGDPSVSDHMRKDAMAPLREIVDSLAARGVKRVRGRVIAEGDAFPDPVLGFGWSWSDLESDYSAATDELLFNEGFTDVIVHGGRTAGDSVTVETRPTKTWPRLRVSVTTVDKPAPIVDSTAPRLPRPGISIRKDTLTGEVYVTGTIAAGDSTVESVTHRDPDAAFIAAFREALGERGIAVDGDTLPAGVSDTLVVMASPPLSDVLVAFLKPSQNQLGEMLFKTLGLERDSAGTAVAGRRVVTKQLREWGVRDEEYIIRDGSGLSRYDYVTPTALIHILDAMRRSRDFPTFYSALPIAGVDGTIRSRMRGTPAENNVHAKTGSVAQARSLSGYVRTLDGDTLMFSILTNNWNVPPRSIERAIDSIAVRLASFRRH